MLLLKLMDNVHFKIKKDTINRVLTRSMEMELKSVKLGLWNMRVIQRDGLSGHHVFVLSLSGTFVNIDVPLLVSLMIFQLFSILIDLIVFDIKSSILEGSKDLDVSFEIDWGLLITEFNHAWIKRLL